MDLNAPTALDALDLEILLRLGVAAVVGIACGAGQWPLVAIAAIISVIMLSVLGVVQHRLIKSDVDEKDRE